MNMPYQLGPMDRATAFEAVRYGFDSCSWCQWVLDKLVKSLVFETRVVLGSKPRDPAITYTWLATKPSSWIEPRRRSTGRGVADYDSVGTIW